MSQTAEFVRLGKEGCVCASQEALYKLRQASYKSHLTLHKFLFDYEFEKSKADPTLYVRNRD